MICSWGVCSAPWSAKIGPAPSANHMAVTFFQWGQLVIGAMGLVFSGVGLGCIVWGLFSMQAAGQRRDREIDELAAAFRKQGEAMTQAFTQQGQVLAELLRRTA